MSGKSAGRSPAGFYKADPAARRLGRRAACQRNRRGECDEDAVGRIVASKRAGLLARVIDERREVVLQVVADARERCRAPRCRVAPACPDRRCPDSINSCGELMTPPARITSRSARAVICSPASVIFDADGAAALEHDAVRQRTGRPPSGWNGSAPGAGRPRRHCSAGRRRIVMLRAQALPAGRRCSRWCAAYREAPPAAR